MKKEIPAIDKMFVQLLKDSRQEPHENNWKAIENELNRRDAEKYKIKYTVLRKTLICLVLTGICLLLSYVLQEAFEKTVTKNGISFLSSSEKDNKEIVGNNQAGRERSKAGNEKGSLLPVLKGITIISADIRGNTSPATGIGTPDTDFTTVPDSSSSTFANVHARAADSIIALPGYAGKNDLSPDKTIYQPAATFIQSKLKQQQPAFFIIPYFSFDHISGRFQEQYKYNGQPAINTGKKEKPDMSYTFGLLSEYGLTRKISVQAGLLISNAFTTISATTVKALQGNTGSYKFRLATIYGLAEIKNAAITSPQQGDSLRVSNGALHLRTLTVPLMIKLNLTQRKIQVSPLAGIVVNRIISDKAEIEYITANHTEKETIQKIEGIRNTYLSLAGGADIVLPISKKLSIAINPLIRYAITPVNKGTPVKTFPVSIAAGAAVRIRL